MRSSLISVPTTGRWRAPLFLTGWFLVGVCVALGVTQLIFVSFPVAAVLIALLALRSQGPELLGIPLGVGALGVWIGANNHYTPCPSNGVFTLLPGQREASCGGFDGLPWLVAGVMVMLGSLVLYAVLTRHASGEA